MRRPYKHLLLLPAIGLFTLSAHAQTATNFNCADCSGTQHDLFTELDAGKVIVIDWVMPCGTCIGPTLTTYNVVQSFQASHPDRVHMYLVDDYANTSCAALNGWKNANGFTNTTTFSNAAINMSHYGPVGMPKVVVLGGPDHLVYYKANNAVNANNLQLAIQEALAATNAIGESPLIGLAPVISPNPADGHATLAFTLAGAAAVGIQVQDLAGRSVQQPFNGMLPQGPHRLDLSTASLPDGIYLLRISTGGAATTLRFNVAHP